MKHFQKKDHQEDQDNQETLDVTFKKENNHYTNHQTWRRWMLLLTLVCKMKRNSMLVLLKKHLNKKEKCKSNRQMRLIWSTEKKWKIRLCDDPCRLKRQLVHKLVWKNNLSEGLQWIEKILTTRMRELVSRVLTSQGNSNQCGCQIKSWDLQFLKLSKQLLLDLKRRKNQESREQREDISLKWSIMVNYMTLSMKKMRDKNL